MVLEWMYQTRMALGFPPLPLVKARPVGQIFGFNVHQKKGNQSSKRATEKIATMAVPGLQSGWLRTSYVQRKAGLLYIWSWAREDKPPAGNADEGDSALHA